MTRPTDDERYSAAADALMAQDLSTLPTPTPAEEAQLLATLPEVETMASRSIRLPADLEADIKARAEREGVSASEWIRETLRRAVTGPSESAVVGLEAAQEALRRIAHPA